MKLSTITSKLQSHDIAKGENKEGKLVVGHFVLLLNSFTSFFVYYPITEFLLIIEIP